MSDSDSGRLLFTSGDEIMVNTVEALLKDNGVPVLRKYRGTGLHMKIIFGNALIDGVDLFVPSPLYDKAKELLDVLLSDDAILEEDEEYGEESEDE